MRDPYRFGHLAFVLAEAALFGLLAVGVADGVVGATRAGSPTELLVSGAFLALVLAMAATPVWIWWDVYRHDDDPTWVVAALLPVVNLVGLIAYLLHRRTRTDGDATAEPD